MLCHFTCTLRLETRCVCEAWMRQAVTISKSAKISKLNILTPTHLQGHVVQMKCKQSSDQLQLQGWFLYHYLNIKYCTLYDPITR